MSIPAGSPGLSGGRPARLTQNLKVYGPSVKYNVSNGLMNGCVVCDQKDNVSRCSGCSIIRYCSSKHQRSDWANHKSTCTTLKTLRKELFKEEAIMYAMEGEEVFKHSKGLFWTNPETREYMRARWKLAEELMRTNTDLAVEAALDHMMEMNLLCRADNQGVRWMIPALLMRLRRDQEAYDYCKWWTTKGDYNFNDTSLPFLEKKNQDVYEPVDEIFEFIFISHLVALTLLKIRLLLDLQILRSAKTSALNIPDFSQEILAANLRKHAISSATRTDTEFLSQDPSPLITELENQIRMLYEHGKELNPFFWPALLDPGNHLTVRPGYYKFQSEGEMQYALQYNYNAWVETAGAIDIIRELSKK